MLMDECPVCFALPAILELKIVYSYDLMVKLFLLVGTGGGGGGGDKPRCFICDLNAEMDTYICDALFRIGSSLLEGHRNTALN